MKKYLLQYWQKNLVLFCLIVGGATAQILAGVLNARAFNAIISFNLQEFLITMGIITLLWITFLLLLAIRMPYETAVTQCMITEMRKDIAQDLQGLDYVDYHEYKTGSFSSWLTTDINTIETSGFRNFYQIVTMIVQTIGSIIGLIYFHWSILLFSVVGAFITLWLPSLGQKKLHAAMGEMTREQENFLSTISNTLKGFDTLFSYNLLSKIVSAVTGASKKVADKKYNQSKATALTAILGASGNVISQVGVLLLTGYLAFLGATTIGAITAAEALSNNIFNSVGNMAGLLAELRSTQSIFDKFSQISKKKDNEKAQFIKQANDIQLNQLSYHYGDNVVVDQLSYQFEQHKKYAIVGPSGSGKSTLLKILSGRLLDYGGSAKVLGNEIKSTDGSSLRDHVIYLDQDPHMFEGTLRENITLGEEFTAHEINQALEKAGLLSYIELYPGLLDKDIGEDGRLLSGGQRQRLALARGFIRNKKIVLLDEGTSNLDNQTAKQIEQGLVNNDELTVIMITHHLSEELREKLDDVLDLGQLPIN